ncbi:MAG: hypothetical protein BWZ07_02855 [Alphaproteobacteria bacterium ADurb.BinA280]|nr:MAG: hypothetical protein BWZ07_02855 [Alphaproteobacteria bacterium ADurb.BinA280]
MRTAAIHIADEMHPKATIVVFLQRVDDESGAEIGTTDPHTDNMLYVACHQLCGHFLHTFAN